MNIRNQIRNVLRLKKGDRIVLVCPPKKEAVVTIKKIEPRRVVFEVEKVFASDRETKRAATLYVALLKHKNFEWVVEKATEVGITAIIPLVTSRTVKLGLKKERLLSIMREAAEQSGRTVVPELCKELSFSEALRHAQDNDTNYFFDTTSKNHFVSDPRALRRGLFIGPEGGWTEKERLEAKNIGVSYTSLGALTLRAETAAVVASYLVIHM